MLNTDTLIAASNCLVGDGEGKLTIVSDNLLYTRSLARSICALLSTRHMALENNQTPLMSSSANCANTRTRGRGGSSSGAKINGTHRSLLHAETVRGSGGASINILVGTPTEALGYAPGGNSYFDKLWQTGAGSYARSSYYVISSFLLLEWYCYSRCCVASSVRQQS
jgi:hypothetical protein